MGRIEKLQEAILKCYSKAAKLENEANKRIMQAKLQRDVAESMQHTIKLLKEEE